MHLPRDGLELILISAAKSILGLDNHGGNSKSNDGNGSLIADIRSEDVVVARVLKVELEGLDRAKTAVGSYGGETKESNHGETAVLNFLEASLSRVHASGILELVVPSFLPALGAESLEDDESRNTDNKLSLGVYSVFLSAGCPPVTLAEEVGGEDASDRSHCPATVDHLSVLEVLEELRLGTEAEGVEAIVCEKRWLKMGICG